MTATRYTWKLVREESYEYFKKADEPEVINENDLLTEEEAVDQAIEATKIRLVELEGRKRLLSE